LASGQGTPGRGVVGPMDRTRGAAPDPDPDRSTLRGRNVPRHHRGSCPRPVAAMSDQPRRGERGAVLLVVLGMSAMLALLGTRLTSQSRTELRVAAAYRTGAAVEMAADSAVHEAAMRLLKGEWAADGPPVSLRVGGILA